MMQTYFDLEKHELVVLPETDFEGTLLNDFLGEGYLMGTTLLNPEDNTVVGIVIKSEKELANSSNEEDPITVTDIDIMYDKMVGEKVGPNVR